MLCFLVLSGFTHGPKGRMMYNWNFVLCLITEFYFLIISKILTFFTVAIMVCLISIFNPLLIMHFFLIIYIYRVPSELKSTKLDDHVLLWKPRVFTSCNRPICMLMFIAFFFFPMCLCGPHRLFQAFGCIHCNLDYTALHVLRFNNG